MIVKWTMLGLLIYLAMAAWVVALSAYVVSAMAGGKSGSRGRSSQRIGSVAFALGSGLLAAGMILRWIEAGHVPLQSMFEVCLCLGMLMFPLWAFCRRFLGARGPAISVLVGLVLLVPVGFYFKDSAQPLPPALQSGLFVPHVGAYMLAYVILAMAGGQAILQLVFRAMARRDEAAACELAAARTIRLGLPLLTLGLVLGALWGKLAWGDYWNWDPKELWSLATFLIYVAYLHVRALYGSKYATANAALAIAGLAAIVVTLVVVNLSNAFYGMHSYAS